MASKVAGLPIRYPSAKRGERNRAGWRTGTLEPAGPEPSHTARPLSLPCDGRKKTALKAVVRQSNPGRQA